MEDAPSQLEQDLDVIVVLLKSDARPTPEQVDAVARVGKSVVLGLASVAFSLRRIAEAAEKPGDGETTFVNGGRYDLRGERIE